jgi:replication factor C subunit 2/4
MEVVDDSTTMVVSSSSSSTTTTAAPREHLPWIEKYRPVVVDDIVGNAEAVDRLRVIAHEGNVPNLLISVCTVMS